MLRVYCLKLEIKEVRCYEAKIEESEKKAGSRRESNPHNPLIAIEDCEGWWLVRVLLRQSVVVASPKPIVINHTQLFTFRFGTSVPKSKSGSYKINQSINKI